MQKQMPESHPTHVYDKYAWRNLDDFMPDHWKLFKSGDFHSGIEYGDDWVCTLAEQAQDRFLVSGAKFFIQSKSTEKDLGKKPRRIGMRCKVSTLNYLHSLNFPVVMHFYHRPSNTGYWMWFDEYYQREYRPSWEKKDKIDVYIPTKAQNVLSKSTFEVIRKRVLSVHYLHHLQKQAATETRIDPNYGYLFQTDGIQASVSIYAKHPQAFELHPLDLDIELDEKANETFIHAMKWGQPAEFDAITSIRGVPDWLTALSGATSRSLVKMFPLESHEHSCIQVEYLDEHDNQLFKSKVFEMSLVQPGTHYHRYAGTSKAEPLTLTAIFDSMTPSTKLSIGFDDKKLNVVSLDWYLDLLSRLKATKTVRIYNLDTGEDHKLLDYEPFIIANQLEDAIRQFIRNLAVISKALKTEIVFPDQTKNVSQSDLLTAEIMVEIIEQGHTQRISILNKQVPDSILPIYSSVDSTQKILQQLEAQEFSIVAVVASYSPSILDYSFDLGQTRYMAYTVDVINKDELESELQKENLDSQTNLHVKLKIDSAQSGMVFENWIEGKAHQ